MEVMEKCHSKPETKRGSEQRSVNNIGFDEEGEDSSLSDIVGEVCG